MLARPASIRVRTPSKVAVVNVTEQVRRALASSGVHDGLVVASVPHTTCGLCVNEDETGLREDLARLLERLLDPLAAGEPFKHDRIDDNARAHLTAALIGHTASLPIVGGDLRLGTWQSLFLMEMDGPRDRSIDLTFVGDGSAGG